MHLPNKLGYFLTVAFRNPSELPRILRIACNSFYFRFIRRCTGKGTIVGTDLRIINSSNVSIGADCLLQDSIYIRAGTNGHVHIDDGAALNSFVKLFGHGGIDIGEKTQLGPGTLVTTTGHDYQQDMAVSYQKISIGKNVWVGANVTILQGVTIGDGSVIGAGAVVNKDIPPNSLAVGVPAKVVRNLVGNIELAKPFATLNR